MRRELKEHGHTLENERSGKGTKRRRDYKVVMTKSVKKYMPDFEIERDKILESGKHVQSYSKMEDDDISLVSKMIPQNSNAHNLVATEETYIEKALAEKERIKELAAGFKAPHDDASDDFTDGINWYCNDAVNLNFKWFRDDETLYGYIPEEVIFLRLLDPKLLNMFTRKDDVTLQRRW